MTEQFLLMMGGVFFFQSSTSCEVCELWNGQGIVRLLGSPDIVELMYDPSYMDSLNPTSDFGIHTLDEMTQVVNTGTIGYLDTVLALFRRRNPSSAALPTLSLTTGGRPAPNISLNVTGHHGAKREIVWVACAAVLLQVGVLVYQGVITYTLRWRLGGEDIRYAFPLTATGTLAISGGMFLCAFVIEASTEEVEYEISANGNKLQILWLQRSQKVNDQEFASYAIYAASNQHRMMTSRSSLHGVHRLQRLTTIGVVCSTVGES